MRTPLQLALPLSFIAVFPFTLGGQSPPPASKQKIWIPPRTPDGQPDLQGVWTNATLTPMERPPELGSKAFFTAEEAAAYEKRRMEQTDADRPDSRRAGDVGSYNQFWFDRGTQVVHSRRTSLVIDPPDGRIPPMTPEARRKFEQEHAPFDRLPANGPEDRLLTERCILFGGAGPPMLPEPYNNNYLIVQSPGYVTILAELNHEARIIPLDSRPLEPGVPEWTGNSRGHWEGDTLVIESRDFLANQVSRFGVAYLDGMSDENLRVTERLARVGADTILYQATISDPTVYTRPWTVEIPLRRRNEPLYEYACHEGNLGMNGILSGARAAEALASR
jgi:hypothetical protein